MRERELVNALVSLMNNVPLPNQYVQQYVKLDYETLDEHSVKHFCPVSSITMNIEIQTIMFRDMDKIGTLHLAFCQHCTKAYYAIEFNETVDLTPYKEQYKMATGGAPIPNKEQFILGYVFPTPIEIINVTPYSATVLEPASDPGSLSKLNESITNKDIKEQSQPQSWSDLF